MSQPNRKQRARAGLSHALRQLHQVEADAHMLGVSFAAVKKELRHVREVARLATEDARKAGLLS